MATRRTFDYPAALNPEEEGGFWVSFPDLPEALTGGDDRADALAEAADCLDEALAARIVMGDDIPLPSRPVSGNRPEHVLVAAGTLMAVKAALYLALRDAALSKSELARRLGCDEKEVRRLLDPRHASKIERIDQALAVLGQRLVIGVEAA